MRADQYGVRTWLRVEDPDIRFEIVREARVTLTGAMDERLGVPVLALVIPVARNCAPMPTEPL